MANKRSADKDINHDNWDQEDESEEAGVFRHASKEVIEKREIKKAKRRVLEDESSGAGSGSLGLKGFRFGGLNSTTSSFSFATQMNTTSGDASKAAFSNFKFSSAPLSTATVSTAASSFASLSNNPLKSSAEEKTKESESEYRNSLRNLNESVLRWITDHVKKNPYCILSPVFSDYEKYIKQFESDFLGGSISKSTPSFSFGSSSLASTSTVATTREPAFGAGFFSTSTKPTESAAIALTVATAKGFSFGTTTTGVSSSGFGSGVSGGSSSVPHFTFGVQSSKDVTPKPSAGFGQSTIQTSGASNAGAMFSTASSGEAPSTSKPFSFGSSSSVGSSSGSVLGGFVFGSSMPSTSAAENDATQETSQAEGDDGNYVPPKPEVVDVQEDDAFHTVRCKLFFKIGNEFKDRGIGNLYLKPCGEKTQLLVRAGTALGNILLNIMLSKGIPSSRQGNKVTMVCIPNPPLSEKEADNKTPICIVFRVKTDDEAETLLKQINDHKA